MTPKRIHELIDQIETLITQTYNTQASILQAANVSKREYLPNDSLSAQAWDNEFQIKKDLNDYIRRITRILEDAHMYIMYDLS